MPGVYLSSGGSNYTPPTYTAGSVLFVGSDGAPTEDNANLFYDESNVRFGIGVNTALNGVLHVKALDDTSGNIAYFQNNANDTYVRIRNIGSTVQDAFVTIQHDTNQPDATVVVIGSSISGLPKFNFYADGFLQFSSAGYIGTIAPTVNNTLALSNLLSAGGIALGYESDGVFGADPITQLVSIGLLSTFTGTGNVNIAQLNLIATYNQASGTGMGAGIVDSTTLTSITGTYCGFYFNPTVTSVAADGLHGIRIVPATAASAFGMSAIPTAFLHVGAATATGHAQFKFTLGGTILTTEEPGTMEADNTHIYWTDAGGTRHQLDQQGGGLSDGDYGDITVSSSGTVFTIDNMSSATLAGKITDETGTGVLVFGTSPTITTSIVSGSTTMAIFNTVATTVNAFGAATTLNLANVTTGNQTTNIATNATGTVNITIGPGSGIVSSSNQNFFLGCGANDGGQKQVEIGTAGTAGSSTVIKIGGGDSGSTTTLQINLNSSATGDTFYRDSGGNFSRLAIGGTAGQVYTVAAGLPSWASNFGTTSSVVTVSSIEVGNASDTTLTRSAAGILAVEGVAIPTISSTHTLTNKRITDRTDTVASSATPTINTDNVDFYSITALAVDITSMTSNLSGTPTENQPLTLAITGTATRNITWGASFENGAATLPAATSGTNRLDVHLRWNSVTSKWRCMAAV